MDMPLCLWCRIAIGFSWFYSLFLLVLAFYVLRVLGIGWERGKLMELRERCVNSNKLCKTGMKLGMGIRATKGKSMITSWIGWIHCCKWIVEEKS